MPKVLWSEEFRPKTLPDCILPARISQALRGYVSQKSCPHLIFYGQAGTSKTTAARCLASDMGSEVLFFNASDETKKSEILDLVVPFAGSVSMGEDRDAPKVIIADEAERMDTKAQDSLKGFLEKFSGNCRMVMTVNSFQMIIPPLKSRAVPFCFNPEPSEKPGLVLQALRRSLSILRSKGVQKVSKEHLAQHVKALFPDMRKIVNSLETFVSSHGEVSEGILPTTQDSEISSVLLPLVHRKDFQAARKLVSETVWPAQDIIDALFGSLDSMPSNKIPQMVLILADWSYKLQFSHNHQICLLAMLAEIMSEI
jgi:DNA polymerase III delta prime subunit